MIYSQNQTCKKWALNCPLFPWACLKCPVSSSQRREVSKLLTCVVLGLVLNVIVTGKACQQLNWLYVAQPTKPNSTPLYFPTTPSSLHSRRGWQVVLLVLEPGQPVGGFSSSSLVRQESCVYTRRPMRKFSSSPLLGQVSFSKTLPSARFSSAPMFRYSSHSSYDSHHL